MFGPDPDDRGARTRVGRRRSLHPDAGDVTLACPGFNDKNDYERQTPCDQDFIRKFASDTETDLLAPKRPKQL